MDLVLQFSPGIYGRFREQQFTEKFSFQRHTVDDPLLISLLYQLFDQQRKQHATQQADSDDLQALSQLEDEIKQGGH